MHLSGCRVLFSTATRNEAGNIAERAHRVHESLPQADILEVDDNSPDGMTRILKELGTRFTQPRLMSQTEKLGLASAHRLGMREFRHGNYDALVTLNAELSNRPVELHILLSALFDFDYVIGTRFGEGKSEYKAWREFIGPDTDTDGSH